MNLNINCREYQQNRNQLNQAQSQNIIINNTKYQSYQPYPYPYPYPFANLNEHEKRNWNKQETVYTWTPNAGISDQSNRIFTKQNDEDIDYLMLSCY